MNMQKRNTNHISDHNFILLLHIIMKKTSYKKYQKFVSKKKEELLQSWLLEWMPKSRQKDLLYGRLIIEIYNKFLKEEWEDKL